MIDLGAEVREITLSPLADYVALQSVISRSHSYSIHEATLKSHPEAYGKFSRERLTLGSLYTAADYINALRLQAELVAEMLAAFNEGDIMMTPTLIYGDRYQRSSCVQRCEKVYCTTDPQIQTFNRNTGPIVLPQYSPHVLVNPIR